MPKIRLREHQRERRRRGGLRPGGGGGDGRGRRVDDAGATLVELRSRRHNRGVGEWIDSLIGGGARSDTTLSLKKRLAYVQFEAERRSRGGA